MRPSALAVGVRGLCPQCGHKTLFSSPVSFASACSSCGLDYSALNVGDGPAAFVTAIGGAVVVILALTVELVWEPPIWVHVVLLLWLPLTLLLVVCGLRVTKGWLLASEWRRDAREGRGR